MNSPEVAPSVRAAPKSIKTPTLASPRRPRVRRPKETPPPRLETLPELYGETRIALQEVQPWQAYAYWEIAPEDLERAKRGGRDPGEIVIRIYDVTFVIFDEGGARAHFDIDVGRPAGNWYVNLWGPDKSVIADIGLRGPDGQLQTLARSNCVQTPRAGEAEGGGPTAWLRVGRDPRWKKYVSGERDGAAPAIGRPPDMLSPSAAMARICREDVVNFYRDLIA